MYDVLVIGAGFGGLGAALTLAERGASVCVCEALKYPGGCAGTFRRRGARFDAGATLLSGLGETQLFGRWAARHGMTLDVSWMDPLVELRTPETRLAVVRDRDAFVADLAHGDARVHAFFREQARVASALWRLFDDPSLLPPLRLRALPRLASRVPSLLPVLPLLGRPLLERLVAHGVAGHARLRTFVDALCQITVQCPAAEAETPFAYAAMDYFWRGTAHVRGGVGELAWELWRAIERLGGTMRAPDAVTGLTRERGYWRASARSGPIEARAVIANVLPSTLARWTPVAAKTHALADAARRSWGAAMLFALARAPAGAREEAHHLELVEQPASPFVDGNHVFVSISGEDEGRAPDGLRTVTASTHVALSATRSAIEHAQTRMRRTLESLAPEWRIERLETASPRTFERFTRRPGGAVGGIPRRAGLDHYLHLGPHEAARDLWLVGDSVFPGQSALATAIGGTRAAERIR